MLAGIKFLEARTLRDGTLLLCLAAVPDGGAVPAADQSPLAAAATLPALLADRRHARCARRAQSPRRRLAAGAAPRRSPRARCSLQGLPLAAAAVPALPAARRTAVGPARRPRARATGLSDTDGAGRRSPS
ncbi:MAG: hypothetical protein MZW92_70535 [Comamonadaceae bacterium]|nr:hypothetical protein [Comamonadaceae bacterium]